jgi:predicted PurR-regulated permease PerM
MMPAIIQLPPKRTLGPWLLGITVTVAMLLLAYWFRAALILGLGAFALAYMASPAVKQLQRLRVPKPIAIITVLLGGTLTVLGSFALLIPELIRQVQALLSSLPRYLAYVQTHWIPYVRTTLHIRVPPRIDEALAQFGVRASSVAPQLGEVATSGLALGVLILEGIFTLIVLITLAYYLSSDFDSIRARAFDLLPHRIRPRAAALLGEIDETLRHFISGQLLVMAVLGTLYSVGLGALGVPAGWAIGIFSGLISFVPYVGFFIALGLALLMSALSGQGGEHLLAVAGVMAVVHILDLSLITPRIVGNRTRLSPATVILSMIGGGAALGFAGVLVAIPAASVCSVLLRHLVAVYKNTNFFLDGSDSAAIASVPLTNVPPEMLAELAAELEPSPLAYKLRTSKNPGEMPAASPPSSPTAAASGDG